MRVAIPNPMRTKIVSGGELTELIRGNEEGLLARLTPLVRRYSVTLDLSRVRRIDAGGITALVSLYESAREAGHSFTVANLSPHAAEILRLVGLKAILQSHIAVRPSQFGMHLQQTVARKYPSRLLIPA
jgi:anti-anti-sigma regulatory factor